jgi:hypothetical protein
MLESLLASSQYIGKEDEGLRSSSEAVKPITRQSLRTIVQASEDELNAALDILGVVEMQGELRWLSKTVIQDVTALLFNSMIEHSWPLSTIDEQKCMELMPDIEPVIIAHAISKLGKRTAYPGIWSLDLEKVLRKSADIIFNSSMKEKSVCILCTNEKYSCMIVCLLRIIPLPFLLALASKGVL